MVREKPYTYGEHWGPHDIEQREISSALTRRQIAFNHDLRFQVTPKLEIADGITAVQALLARGYFNEATTAHGVDCLRQYRKTYQPRLDQFPAKPVHNWASHGADAFRGLAVRHKMPQIEEDAPPPYVPRSVWG